MRANHKLQKSLSKSRKNLNIQENYF